ncbi:MAG: aminotransferase class V-fold PLP-dependent enzyme [Flavobacteriaceae bacterium]
MRQHYPILSKCLYFNTAYTAPLSEDLSNWRQKEDGIYLDAGDHYKTITEKSHVDEAKTTLAHFADADKEMTFITANFSAAFQNFLLHLPRDATFLLLEDEYPSLTGMVNDFGFESTVLSLSSAIEEDVWSHLQENSYTVFALSAIQYSSGLYFDIAWLEKIKKAFPKMLLLIDGTQFLGAEVFSFAKSPFDAIFGSTYKWLMATYGTGYALLKPSLLEEIGVGKNKIAATYDRGQLSVKAVGSLTFSLNQIIKANFSKLMEHKQNIARVLFEELKKRALLSEMISKRKQHSSIYNLSINDEVYQFLLSHHVRCIKRGAGVRIAVHHYNNQQDIDALLQLLDEVI